MLSTSPLAHLDCSCKSKEQTGESLRRKREQQPTEQLHSVIRTSNVLKQEPMRYLVSFLARSSEITLKHMTPEVA